MAAELLHWYPVVMHGVYNSWKYRNYAGIQGNLLEFSLVLGDIYFLRPVGLITW